MKKKFSYILIGCIVFVIVVLLSVLLSRSLQREDGPGLLAGDQQEQTPTSSTLQEREEEYESREEMPATTMESLPDMIRDHLSSGQFQELDARLKDLAETYKDNADQSDDESIVTDGYRADITYYLSMLSGEALDYWAFQNPDVLAAAVAYAPVSVKYKAFISRGSALMSPANGNINLRESDLSAEEQAGILEDINRLRTEQGRFLSIKAYDMSMFGYTCRFIAVRDASYYYQPYSVTVLDEPYDITCDLADAIIQGNPTASLDSMFAAPSRTDPDAVETDVPDGSASTDSMDTQSETENTSTEGDTDISPTDEETPDNQTQTDESVED